MGSNGCGSKGSPCAPGPETIERKDVLVLMTPTSGPGVPHDLIKQNVSPTPRSAATEGYLLQLKNVPDGTALALDPPGSFDDPTGGRLTSRGLRPEGLSLNL